MDLKVLKYRQKHKKCRYCKYLNFVVPKYIIPSYYKCLAKDKIIKDIFPDMTKAPRWFCSCYEVRDEL